MQITPVALRPAAATKKSTAPPRRALPHLSMSTLSLGIGPEPPSTVLLSSAKEIIQAARAELQAADEQTQTQTQIIRYSAPPPPPVTQAPAPQSDFVLDTEVVNPPVVTVQVHPRQQQPKKMTRAKSWSPEIENLFRYQSAGYRDASEYLMSNPNPDFWPDSKFVRCLKSKETACFLYFRQHRECIDSFLNKIKIYSY